MRRRDLVTFVARAAAVWPGIAPAQCGACRYLYASMRRPIDAALGDGKR